MGDRCRLCSKPMLDLSLSKKEGFNHESFAQQHFVQHGHQIKSFFMLGRMLVTQ